MGPWHPLLGLVDAVTFVALFFLAVFLFGLVVGLALMFWRARQDRRYLRLRQGKNEITARIATKTSTA
jgi:HAMP domain-containing protein